MVWPPPTQKLDWQNADISLDQHPTAHNDIAITLANDYQPQINTNKLDIAANVASIAGNTNDIAAVDNAWQQNEAARNAWYRVGPDPTIDAGSGTAYVEGRGLRMRDDSANLVPGYVPSVVVQQMQTVSEVGIGSTWTSVSPTVSVDAEQQSNAIHIIHWSIDANCLASGTLVGGISVNNSDPSSSSPQIVWKSSLETGITERQTLSTTYRISTASAVNFRIKAKENSGTFTASATHTQLTVVSYYGMR